MVGCRSDEVVLRGSSWELGRGGRRSVAGNQPVGCLECPELEVAEVEAVARSQTRKQALPSWSVGWNQCPQHQAQKVSRVWDQGTCWSQEIGALALASWETSPGRLMVTILPRRPLAFCGSVLRMIALLRGAKGSRLGSRSEACRGI